MDKYPEKDSSKMNTIALKTLLITGALFVWATAATDSVIAQRSTLLDNMRTMDFSNPGVLFTGEIVGGANSSIANAPAGKTTETQAFTEANVVIQARPTKDTRAEVHFRAHQDWNKAHEMGVNPVLFDWWSYWGSLFEGKGSFVLGDMRVNYSPLTLSTPQLDLLQEPTIMEERRMAIMADRNLDGSVDRLMQGLNVSWSNQFSVFDQITAQASISRLRNQAKKADQYFYDFDHADRYMVGSRAGLSLYGFELFGNFVYSFNRDQSAENFFTGLLTLDSILLENNRVASAQFGYDFSKSFMKNKPLKLSLQGEFALSNYESKYLYKAPVFLTLQVIDSMTVHMGGEDVMLHSLVNQQLKRSELGYAPVEELDGQAFNVSLVAKMQTKQVEGDAKIQFIQNNQNFESELAMSPVYLSPISVLNSKGLSQLGLALGQMRGNYESMYFSVYNTVPLSQNNLVASNNPAPSNQLLNNYKLDHFTRNGFTNEPLVRSERIALGDLDPGVQLALPYGVSTPDRQGVAFSSDALLLNDALETNLRFSMLNAPEADLSFMTIGAGFAYDLAKSLGWSRQLSFNGAFEMATETNGSERSSQRIAFGIDEGSSLFKSLSFHVGFQRMTKEFGTAQITTLEDLVLVGPSYQLTTGTKVVAQYGILNQSLEMVGTPKVDVNRQIMMAEVQMKF